MVKKRRNVCASFVCTVVAVVSLGYVYWEWCVCVRVCTIRNVPGAQSTYTIATYEYWTHKLLTVCVCVCASPVCMHTQCCVVLKVWLIYNIEKKCCLLSCRDTGTALPIAKEMNILIQMLLPLCPVHMMCNVCVCVHVCCLRHCNKYETLINWMSQRHIMYTYYMRINNTTAYTMHNLYVHMHACYAFAITKNIHMGKTMLNVFSWRTKNKKKNEHE